MLPSARLFHCIRCHAQVLICRNCDHGQRYCLNGCARHARKASLHRACQKYQSGRAGRLNNAARQRRFRERLPQIVTHQGSPATRSDVVLSATSDHQTNRDGRGHRFVFGVCHGCGCPCSPFLRTGFLTTGPTRRKSGTPREADDD